MKKKKKKKKKLKAKKSNSTLKIVNLKISPKDREKLRKLALRFAKGNLSAWLRHAGLRYTLKSKNERVAKY